MSDGEDGIDLPTFDSNNTQQFSQVERANLSLKLLPSGKIEIDWTGFPIHPSCRKFIVHYRSLNNNQVKLVVCVRGRERERLI